MATLIEDLKTFTPRSSRLRTTSQSRSSRRGLQSGMAGALYRISLGRKPPPHKNADDISQHLSIVVMDWRPR